MPAATIDGKNLAKKIKDGIASEIASLGIKPGLAVILVGNDAASHLYVNLKEKACRDAGIAFEKILFPEDAPETDVLAALEALNSRDDVDAILVQLPLPDRFDEQNVIEAMVPSKDADGFHPANLAALRSKRGGLMPGLVAGIIELIRATNENVAGKTALVVANSRTFFDPLEVALADEGIDARFAAPDAASLADLTKTADILIVAAGRPRFITGAMLKPGGIVIDVGTNRMDGKTVGDADAASAQNVAAHLTPVPGGVGPMTVAMLLKNTLELAKRRRGL